MTKALSVLVLVLSIAGCAHPQTRKPVPIDGLFVKEDFKGPQLAQGGLVVGGIVAEPGKFDMQQSEDLTPLIVKAFQLERRYLAPQSTATLRDILGQRQYMEVMTQFAEKELNENTLASIGTALPNTRYLALARVEENADGGVVTFRKYQKETPILKDRPYTLYVRHFRTMAVTMTIYDLKNRSIAFSGRLKDHIANQITFEGGSEPHTLVGILVTGYKTPVNHAPPMPSTNELLPYYFIAFGSNLPVLYCNEVPSGTVGCIDTKK